MEGAGIWLLVGAIVLVAALEEHLVRAQGPGFSAKGFNGWRAGWAIEKGEGSCFCGAFLQNGIRLYAVWNVGHS